MYVDTNVVEQHQAVFSHRFLLQGDVECPRSEMPFLKIIKYRK